METTNETPISTVTNIVLNKKKGSPFINQGCEPTAREYKVGVAYTAGQEAAFRSKASSYAKSKGWAAMTRVAKDDKGIITGVLVQFSSVENKAKATETTKAVETENATV